MSNRFSVCGHKTECCSVIATRLFPSLFSGKREYNALSSPPLLFIPLSPVARSSLPFSLPVRRKEERKKICCSFFTPLCATALWVTAAATTISFESAHAPLPFPRPTATARPSDRRAEEARAELFSDDISLPPPAEREGAPCLRSYT